MAESCACASSAALGKSTPADPGSRLSALQKRLLAWRGRNRASATASSPVRILPRSTTAKPGAMPSTPVASATAIPASLMSIASALTESDAHRERDALVGRDVLRRNELVVLDHAALRLAGRRRRRWRFARRRRGWRGCRSGRRGGWSVLLLLAQRRGRNRDERGY